MKSWFLSPGAVRFGLPEICFGFPGVRFGIPEVRFGFPEIRFGLPGVRFGPRTWCTPPWVYTGLGVHRSAQSDKIGRRLELFPPLSRLELWPPMSFGIGLAGDDG